MPAQLYSTLLNFTELSSFYDTIVELLQFYEQLVKLPHGRSLTEVVLRVAVAALARKGFRAQSTRRALARHARLTPLSVTSVATSASVSTSSITSSLPTCRQSDLVSNIHVPSRCSLSGSNSKSGSIAVAEASVTERSQGAPSRVRSSSTETPTKKRFTSILEASRLASGMSRK